jgi:hypothetical protein
MEVFDHPQGFDEVECCVYGQRERVRLMSVALLWKPLGESLLFIFARGGPVCLDRLAALLSNDSIACFFQWPIGFG